MAWTDFYMRASGGSDLNAGSTSADVGGGSNSAVYTEVSSNFDGVSVFTPTSGQTTSSFVNVGDYVALYNTGDTVCRCVAKVVTVGAGVNGTITIDTTVKYGTVPTSNSGSRACKAGGSWASLAICASNTPFNTGTAPQSTRINIKAGTYANTSTVRALGMAGTATVELWWRGYNATPGDEDLNNVAVAGTSIPSLTWTTGNLTISSAHQIFSSLSATSAAVGGNGTVQGNAASLTFYRVRASNTAANANGFAFICGSADCEIVASYFTSTTTASKTIGLTGAGFGLFGSIIASGIVGAATSGSGLIAYCLFDSQQGDAITATGSPVAIIGNGFYAPLGNGINITSVGANGYFIANNYFSTVNQAAKSAINNTSGTNTDLIRCVANAYFNCTATLTGITENFAIFDNGTLGSEAFAAPASQNFAILPVGQRIGFPGLFENTNVFRGYLDVGAAQSGSQFVGQPFPG